MNLFDIILSIAEWKLTKLIRPEFLDSGALLDLEGTTENVRSKTC